jgi:two-component system, NtrC family, response regulator HydG
MLNLANAPAEAPQVRLAKAGATRVLVVDDEPTLRRSVVRMLAASGMDAIPVEDGAAALALLERERVHVALVDLMMPKMNGLELLENLRTSHPGVEVIMMTAFGDVEVAVKSVRAGAYDFLEKPFRSNDEVVLTVSKAAERRRLLTRTEMLERKLEQKETFGELIGNTTSMQEVYRLAVGVAPTSSTVLILGESGTGKELTARAIHEHSSRANKPFVAVNCSAIPVDLVESELFGHVRGAFTGAITTREGLFESADQGTIFLDEVGDLPALAQVKLLRALQEGEIKRVGTNETRRVDVRVLAATNVDLRTKIAAGRFREDLFYRLNVICIELPPLRKRRDDIAILAHHFLRKYAARQGREVVKISDEAMRVLRSQNWPGNVRELENAMEHALVYCREDTILPQHLPCARHSLAPSLVEEPSGGELSAALPDDLAHLPYREAKQRALSLFDDAYFSAVMRRTGGNISEAARQAGLDRSNFRRASKRTGRKLTG